MASNKRAKKAATKKPVPAKKTASTPAAAGRNYFKQSEFPLVSLQQAQKIAAAIVDNFASEGGSPPGRSACNWYKPYQQRSGRLWPVRRLPMA